MFSIKNLYFCSLCLNEGNPKVSTFSVEIRILFPVGCIKRFSRASFSPAANENRVSEKKNSLKLFNSYEKKLTGKIEKEQLRSSLTIITAPALSK